MMNGYWLTKNVQLYISWAVMATLTFSLVHCSMPDDVKSAADTSKQLSSKMDSMKTSSASLVDRTSNLFGGARKDLGFERSTERYKDILDAPGDSTKILYATALATGYEFQQWTGTDADTAELKDRMYRKAMRDIFPRFESLINHDYDVNVTIAGLPWLPNNDWKSLASLAVALGEVDEDQQIAAAKSGVGVESLYTLIVKALQYKKVSLYEKNIPQFAREVLTWEPEAVHLLQLRHNYFIAMVMSRFSDYCTSRPREALTWINLWGPWGKPLDIKYMDNIVKIQDQGILWLQMAQETQRVLQMLGYPLQFNDGIMDIFASVKFDNVPKELVGSPIADETFSELNQIVNELKATVKSGEPTAGPIPAKFILDPSILKNAMAKAPAAVPVAN